MAEGLDPFERRLARQLEEFAETPFPASRTVGHVVTRAETAGQPRLPTYLGGLMIVAVALALGFAALWRSDAGLPGASAEASSQPDSVACDPQEFLALMRRLMIDYEPVDSPRELAQRAEIVVVGRVAKADAVPTTTRGTDTFLTINVAEVIQGDRTLVDRGRIVVAVDVDVARAKAIRDIAGCDILLFLAERENRDAEGQTVPRVFTAFAQGFWIESGTSLEGVYVSIDQSPRGWQGIATIGDLREAVIGDAAGGSSAE